MNNMISNKNNILIVSECFYPEEFKINDIAINWKNKGYNVDVLTLFPTYPFGEIYDGYQNKLYKKELYKGINIHRVKAVTGYKNSLFKKILKYFTFMLLGSCYSIIKGKKYDYIFGFSLAALTGMVPATILKKLYNKKVTLWVQDIWPDSVFAYGFKETKLLSFFLNRFVNNIYKNTTNFAVSSPGFINRIISYDNAKDKDIKFLPNWADDLNSKSESFQFSSEKKIHFTFAGNVGKMQNLDNIIKAFGNLTQEYLNKSQLNIIGDGSHLNNLKDLVKTGGYKNIIFWGKKDRSDMGKYFKGSDYLIISLVDKPIFSITIPSKLQTYILAKKPIFAIINGDVASIVKEHNLGLCVSPFNINEIILGFMKFIDMNKVESAKLIEKCDHLTNTIFNKEEIINSLEGLLVNESI